MTLFTDSVFITDELEGFRKCREERTTSEKTMTVLLCTNGHIDVYYHEQMIRINKNDLFVIPFFRTVMSTISSELISNSLAITFNSFDLS